MLTGNLCDALLETRGSAGVLAELEREQFFTTTSDGGLTYHYHQVLQTHLEVLLIDELGGRAARALYARSGQLLEEAGRTGRGGPRPRSCRGLGCGRSADATGHHRRRR